MPKPDLDNGYIRIATELLEALCRMRIPGESMQVFLFIMRKTYGWNKKEEYISLSQFNLGTGLSKNHVLRGVNKLLQMNVISIPQKGYTKGNMYRINKDYSSWKPYPKKRTYPKKGISLPQKGYKPYPKKGHTTDTITNTTNKQRAREYIYKGDEQLVADNTPILKQPEIGELWNQWLVIRASKGKSNPISIVHVCREVSTWTTHKLRWVLTRAIRNEWATLVTEGYQEPERRINTL